MYLLNHLLHQLSPKKCEGPLTPVGGCSIEGGDVCVCHKTIYFSSSCLSIVFFLILRDPFLPCTGHYLTDEQGTSSEKYDGRKLSSVFTRYCTFSQNSERHVCEYT